MKENIAKSIKKTMLEVSFKVRGAHMGSNLSCIDILSALYFDVMNIGEENFEKRDIFILSKAHSALALYCTLYHRGLISKKELDGYYVNDGILPAHLDRFSCKYVEFSGGSLGHGLPIALGYAFSLKQQYFKNKKEKIRNVYCLMGDGEIQEGSVWEAAMLASKLELGNLVALVDYNNLQGYGRAKELVSMDPLDKKWESFGWDCVVVDGHNCTEIANAIKKHKSENKPLCIVCKTVKGKGVSFMEDRLEWHYYAISEDELKQALEELK
ncbi:transketolase [Campylobacter upsaliensis]|nr:transketolase [Campylobacter upsaliensis]EAL5935883.1 transketolase [Campylobacter upsaliensis]EAL5971278.1 transketolase [Campylobacter upsaliensis]